MKKFFSLLAITLTATACQFSSAEVITQVVTSGGSTGDTNIANTVADIQTFVAGGISYDSLIGVGVIDPTEPELLAPQGLALPASDEAAVGDVDLGTGCLNNGGDAVYDLSGQTLDDTSIIYFFGNGNGSVEVDPATGDAINSGGTTPPGTLSFVDAGGAVIGTLAPDFFFQNPGTNDVRAPNLMSFDLIRGNGDDLNNRTVSGAIFEVSEIDFTGGGIGDVVGFSISTATTDVQDVGIAFEAKVNDGMVGDVNCDGAVDLLDVTPFVELITTGEFSVKADINMDGSVDLLDVTPFVALLTGG